MMKTPFSPPRLSPGSHMLPSYYGARRPFISDSDFSNKQFSPDVFSKPLSCDPPAVAGYPALIDSYYPEAFGDYRGATAAAFSGPGGSFLPSAALSSLLPSYGGESSHLFLVGRGRLGGGGSWGTFVVTRFCGGFQRDSWEPAVQEPASQVEPLCADGLASMSSPDPPGSPSQYRSPSRASSMGSQPYALHPLEDAHYHSLTPSTSYPLPAAPFPCPAYMSSPLGDLVSKMVTEEASEGQVGLSAEAEAGQPCWPKEDAMTSWSPYELRRTF